MKVSGLVRVEEKAIINVEVKELKDRMLAVKVTHINKEFSKDKSKS